MDTLSRVKKYEDLRKQIEDNSLGSETLPQEKLQDYAQRLNEIDPSIFKKVNITEEEPYTPERERKVTKDYEQEQPMGEFRNEYLDDFINEVREYNIKKGNRESEDTQIDILNQLNAVSRAKRSDYIQSIEDDVKPTPEVSTTASLNREEIAAQVKSLLEEEPLIEPEPMEPMLSSFIKEEVVEPVAPMTTQRVPKEVEAVKQMATPVQPMPASTYQSMESTSEMQRLMEQAATDTLQVQMPQASKVDPVNATQAIPVQAVPQEKRHPFINRKAKPTTVPTRVEQEEAIREQKLHQKLVEETQQLRVQLNEYEDDLNDLSEGVEKTNKMLNVILGCLILALLVIIGIIIYWIVQAGGLV